jgi:hypothetical protein
MKKKLAQKDKVEKMLQVFFFSFFFFVAAAFFVFPAAFSKDWRRRTGFSSRVLSLLEEMLQV